MHRLSNWAKPLEGGAVGDVIASRAPEFKEGDAVVLQLGAGAIIS